MNEDSMVIATAEAHRSKDGVFIGVVRACSFVRSEGGLVGKAALADNVYWDEESYNSAMACPIYQVVVRWSAGAPHEEGSGFAYFDPAHALDDQIGAHAAVSLGDLFVAMPEIPPLYRVGDVRGQPTGYPMLIEDYVKVGRLWDAVAVLRHRARIVEEVVHRGCNGGNRAMLTVHKLDAPAEKCVPFESPHFEHMDRPLSHDGGGQYKYIIPTRWWDKLLEVKRARMGA